MYIQSSKLQIRQVARASESVRKLPMGDALVSCRNQYSYMQLAFEFEQCTRRYCVQTCSSSSKLRRRRCAEIVSASRERRFGTHSRFNNALSFAFARSSPSEARLRSGVVASGGYVDVVNTLHASVSRALAAMLALDAVEHCAAFPFTLGTATDSCTFTLSIRKRSGMLKRSGERHCEVCAADSRCLNANTSCSMRARWRLRCSFGFATAIASWCTPSVATYSRTQNSNLYNRSNRSHPWLRDKFNNCQQYKFKPGLRQIRLVVCGLTFLVILLLQAASCWRTAVRCFA
jgi:hypothetical protein